MRSNPLVAPRMLSSLDAFYPTLVTIYESTVTHDSESGQESHTFTVRYADVPAAVAPAVVGGTFNTERRTDEEVITEREWIIALQGYYPLVETGDEVALDDGRRYNVLGVEHDSHRKTTRLRAEHLS